MAIQVVLTNRSQETGNLTSVGSDDKVRVSRSVYQGLRSLAKNKTISDDYTNGKLPIELVDLYEKFNQINSGETIDIEIHKLDEYLGSLGISQDYEYTKDTLYIEPWVEYTDQLPSRNVVDDSTGTVNNIIDRATGYNVIHNTEI